MTEYQRNEPPARTAFPIAREGYAFLYAAAFATAVFALLELTIPALVGLVVSFCICGFFRDPDRVVPNDAGAVVSPADGKVITAETADGGSYFEGKCLKISIFMSVFNVHVNRAPVEGEVRAVKYHPGKFFSANLDKASDDNEKNAVYIETPDGVEICTVQVAGLIARRIICRVGAGDALLRGRRFGLICFGSRLDVYVPETVQLNVKKGEKVRAGVSVLGYLNQ
jgi:phosphatidylserine decarboxylase